MGLSEQISDLGKKIESLLSLISGKFKSWDDFVKDKGSEVDSKMSEMDEWKNKTAPSDIPAMTGNLVKDSYVRNLAENGKPKHYSPAGDVVIDAVHPFTEGFESPYISEKADNCIGTPHNATEKNPYYISRYNMGRRISRGGLSSGWGSISGGHILKITKAPNSSSSGWNGVRFTPNRHAVVHSIRFRAYLKIVKGSVAFGTDSGYLGQKRGHVFTKQMTESHPDGWMKVDVDVGVSNVTTLFGSGFMMGFDASEEIEMYLALPSASINPSSNYRIQTVQED